jgi:predicted MFS family arabinose efflux permease
VIALDHRLERWVVEHRIGWLNDVSVWISDAGAWGWVFLAASLVAALLLGIGTALVYPTLLAAVSDAIQPRDRARVVGVYRFWRDFGFVLGALVAGLGADATSAGTAIAFVALLTGASGVVVAATSWRPTTTLRPAPAR